jgi:hypothetical protein
MMGPYLTPYPFRGAPRAAPPPPIGKMMRATLRCKMTHLDFCMKVRGETNTHISWHIVATTLEAIKAL